MSHPAKADVVRLIDRGHIEIGRSADVLLVHENGEFPRVRGTIHNGTPIYWYSHLANVTNLSQLFKLQSEVQHE